MFFTTKSNSCWRSLQRPARLFHARDRGEGDCVIHFWGRLMEEFVCWVRLHRSACGGGGALPLHLNYLDGYTVGKIYFHAQRPCNRLSVCLRLCTHAAFAWVFMAYSCSCIRLDA
mgnify:CR=1 FL=1